MPELQGTLALSTAGRVELVKANQPQGGYPFISCPFFDRRSNVMLFLLRPITGHQRESPLGVRDEPQVLIVSPLFGGSILITSAPRSANNCPQNGPAMKEPISRTLKFANGPCERFDDNFSTTHICKICLNFLVILPHYLSLLEGKFFIDYLGSV